MGATDFRTPRLDRLAADGVRFTSWYSSSPVCSPSRASLLTGRYPGNAGVRAILAGHRQASGLPPSVPTIADALKSLGYRTALFGKWHLGVAEGYRPQDHGFDEWLGFLAGCVDYYSHIFYWGIADSRFDPTHDLWENDREVFRNGEYLTDLIAERSVDFVRRMGRDESPFFLYVPFNAPHYPMHAPRRYVDRFPHLPNDRRIMAAMLSAVDDGVGAVIDELERQRLLEDTFIFFMSDNGPSRETRNWLDGRRDPYYGGTTGHFKGHKFSLYEGGIRSPGILHWPSGIPGGQVVDWPGAAVDLFPSILHAAGAPPFSGEIDGLDIIPALQGGDAAHLRERTLYWEMGRQTAVRRGRWKLLLNGQLVEGAPPEDDDHLSDVAADPGERLNLRDAQTELTTELQGLATRWRAGIEERWAREWLPQTPSLTGHGGGA